MMSNGRVIRSAKTNEMTSPNDEPPCHRAAAKGTLPTEQTKLMTAMNGPTTAFSSDDQKPCPVMKTARHHDVGTSTAAKPATTNPITSSRRSIVRSLIV